MKKVILLSILTLSSLYANLSDDVIGQWKNGASQLEFFDDGTVLFVKNGLDSDGTYSIIGKNRLKMSLEVMGIKMTRVAKVKMVGNKMILTDERDGRVTTYRK